MKKKFLLRISPQLWDELVRWSVQDFRSVNAQIEYLLMDAVRRRGRALPQESEESSEEENHA